MTAVPATLRTKSRAGRGTDAVRCGGPRWPEGPAGAVAAPASPFSWLEPVWHLRRRSSLEMAFKPQR